MPATSEIPTAAQRAVARLRELGQISDRPDCLSRSLHSDANLRAARLILEWMEELGMETAHTRDGSVRGILKGSNPHAAPVLVGSHFDTVIDAGLYDGPLGIISALAAIETLCERGIELPFPVHVLGFSDEEGSRIQTTCVGSRGPRMQCPAMRGSRSICVTARTASRLECRWSCSKRSPSSRPDATSLYGTS